MAVKLEKEHEEAILAQPSKVKDKLLLRLIRKDDILAEQLHFELLEGEEDLLFRRQEIKDTMEEILGKYAARLGDALWSLRNLNRRVNRHKKVTKDAYGEVMLYVFMLKTFLGKGYRTLEILNRPSEKLAVFLVKKALIVLRLTKKLDVEFHLDFQSDLDFILKELHMRVSANPARYLGLPKTFDQA